MENVLKTTKQNIAYVQIQNLKAFNLPQNPQQSLQFSSNHERYIISWQTIMPYLGQLSMALVHGGVVVVYISKVRKKDKNFKSIFFKLMIRCFFLELKKRLQFGSFQKTLLIFYRSSLFQTPLVFCTIRYQMFIFIRTS